MSISSTTPRLAPLGDDELSAEQIELLEAGGASASMNIFRTLVRHPALYRHWSRFAGRLLRRSSFDPRDRELVILRAAWRSDAAYEWGHHVPLGREAGLTDEQMLAVAGRGELAPADALLIRAVDELVDDHRISDATWDALSARLDEQHLIELPLLAGHYAMLAGALNSFGVALEDGYPAFGEV